MAREVNQRAEVGVGESALEAMFERQKDILESGAQTKRWADRERIKNARWANTILFEEIFGINPASRSKSKTHPDNITFWARFHNLDEHGSYNKDLHLEPAHVSANLAIVGATIHIKRDKRLVSGIDIQKDDTEKQFLVAAAIRGISNEVLDTEEEEYVEIDGVYIPHNDTLEVQKFDVMAFDTKSKNSGEITATKDLSASGSNGQLEGLSKQARDTILVVESLLEASVELETQEQKNN